MVSFNFYKRGGVQVILASNKDQINLINWAKENTAFKNDKREVIYLPNLESMQDKNSKNAKGIIIVGTGEDKNPVNDVDFTFDELRYLGFKIYKIANMNKISEIEMVMPQIGEKCNRKVMEVLYEGMIHATYKFDRYITKKDAGDNLNKNLTVNYTPNHGTQEKMEAGFKKIKDIMEGVFLARDLVNQTSNYIYPETLAKAAKDALEPLGVEVIIYNKQQIKEIGMQAFLEVSKGSSKEPYLIVMKYQGDPDSTEFAGLVGKGVTYDSGGYSLKPSDGMVDMHCDMGGAGTVIGTIYALAKIQAKSNVYGVVAACENLVSGTSFKVGDVIGSLSGKTIEVGNTDAEGRLTLADAVYYATENLKVNQVIDLATLTGACLVALGEEYSGVITNDEDYYADLKKSADEVGEKIWLLPNDKKIAEYNKSKVADIKNVGGRLAGTITAGQFIGEFVANEVPWLHIDIAGTAYLTKPNNYLPERATGVHVKTLTKFLSPPEECNHND